MKLSILAGSTSQSVNIFVRDSTSTTGGGLASIAPAGGSLLSGTKLDYSFTGVNAARVNVSLSVLAAVNSAYSSGGIVQIDNTNMIGWIRIDLPDTALATSKGRVVSFLLWGGTNMAPTPFEIELTAVNNQSATAFVTSVVLAAGQKVDVDTIKTNPVVNGGTITFPTNKTLSDSTALAAVAAQLPAALTAGGLMKSDVLSINAVATSAVTTVKAVQGIAVDGVITTATNLTNAPTAGDFTATMKTSIGTAVAASAVASVTGNVGGSVASVVGLTASNLDATVSSRLASSAITLSGGVVSADVKKVNAVTVNGDGSGTPWGP
jgi:hypothetical protein